MSVTIAETSVSGVVVRCHAWLETMRGPQGYGGPVVHWWRNCLQFCGPALDWRYEGIIAGYLTLFERTGDTSWLASARRAGDDLVRGQLPTGNYRDSCFELNPGPAGTPHEAAADVGLLLLARTLRTRGDADWQQYLAAAERNLRGFYLARLWRQDEQRFSDNQQMSCFVPNKAGTLLEALVLLDELTDCAEDLRRYVRPTADAILAHQLPATGSTLDGAIAQISYGRTIQAKYFPYYQARCARGLLAAHALLGDDRYLDGAVRAMRFALRWRDADGAFPQVVYGNGCANRYPRWIAAVGEVLHVLDLLRPHGLDADPEPTRRWLLAGQLPSGGFRSADGFAAQVSQRPAAGPPDARDLLPVVGWTDKAFRYLTTQTLPGGGSDAPHWGEALPCRHRGEPVELVEDVRAIELRHEGRVAYRWRKGDRWATFGPSRGTTA